MLKLETSIKAWGTPEFGDALKREITRLGSGELPLQQGLSTGNYVSEAPISVSILSIAESATEILVKAGIFYQGIIGGCSCTDDPTPVSDINEYCEVRLEIDKLTAHTKVALLAE